MSREKQIEEMAHFICESRKANWADGCRACSHHENRCLYQDIACSLYNAGYRKQSEGEWIYKYAHQDIAYCSSCNFYCQDKINNVSYCYHFCPNCGAKMKGGAE